MDISTVEGTNQVGTLICGINEESSSNSYTENNLFNLPTHVRIIGPCPFSIFDCNNLTNGIEGFKIDGLNNNTTFISHQGTINTPNGNKWFSWSNPNMPVTRINGQNQAPSNWFFDVNNSIQKTQNLVD
ncbi:MAG: hypothetical protein IPK10_15340 [Bacteroidetes bacterium]|nr:hypothetical protein [Bacteroidota bacterium]